MIRPSALALAEQCGYAPVLAAKNPRGSVAAERGTDIHAQLAAYLRGEGVAGSEVLPAVSTLLEVWQIPKGARAEVAAVLRDPETEELLTEGTCDAFWVEEREGKRIAVVVDWKTGQMGYVDPPGENLQLAAYGCALALANECDGYEPRLCFLRDDGHTWQTGPAVVDGEMWAVLARITKATQRDATPVVGPHCDKCFSRSRCEAWMLPAMDGPTALEPFTKPAGLTADNAPRALQVIQAMKKAVEMAESHLKDFAREAPISDGKGKVWGPSQRAGRKSADLKALEADGLTQYLRDGASYEVFTWRKA